jgi:hypothetical protein
MNSSYSHVRIKILSPAEIKSSKRRARIKLAYLIPALALVGVVAHNDSGSGYLVLVDLVISILVIALVIGIIMRRVNRELVRMLNVQPDDLWRGKVVPATGGLGVMVVRTDGISWTAPKYGRGTPGPLAVGASELASIEVGGTRWMGPFLKHATEVNFLLTSGRLLRWYVYDAQGLCDRVHSS